MKTKYSLAISLAVLTGIVSASYGNLITESATTELHPTDLNTALSLGLFDSSLGTLNSVQVTVTGELVGGAQLGSSESENSSNNKGLVTYTLTQALNVLNGSQTLLAMSDVTNPTVNLQSFSNSGEDRGNKIQALDDTVSKVYNYSVSSDLAQYIGKGDATFTVRASGLSSLGSAVPKGVNFSTYSLADATVAISYNYTPVAHSGEDSGDHHSEDNSGGSQQKSNASGSVASVPEPGVGFLLGVGFIGMMAVRYRSAKA